MVARGMDDRARMPDERDLADVLGPAYGRWVELAGLVRERLAPVTVRWVFGGPKYGWSMRLERGKRGLLYMTPDEGRFRVGVALGDAAYEAALAADLPDRLHEIVASAPTAPEGRAVRLTVEDGADVRSAFRLAEIKLTA